MFKKLIDNVKSQLPTKVKPIGSGASLDNMLYTTDGSNMNTMNYTGKAPSKPIQGVKPKY